MTKVKLQIKNRFTGSILFEYESDGNTMAKTVNAAVKAKADLSYSDLSYSDLSYSDLSNCNLRNSDLRNSDLRNCNLSNSDLSYSNLSNSDLSYSDLSNCNLRNSDLRNCNLSNSDLSYSDLSNCNLRNSDLRNCDLSGAKELQYAIALTRICPDGDIIGWKKCKDGIIVKLLIPSEAKRNNAFGRKCRAEFARVIEIFGAETATSSHDNKTTYKVGDTVYPDKWDEDFTNECSSGIHFFITRLEAEKYN